MFHSRGLICRYGVMGVAALLMVGSLTGCKGLLDPTAVGRWQKEPLVVPILDHVDAAAEEANPEFLNATDVRASDLVAPKTDYVIGPDDMLNISITDLIAPGVETVKQMRVSTSGFISLPMIGQVKAAGLSAADLEQEIVKAYRNANIIQNAQVSVTVAEARNRTFSIIGSVAQPGQYAILKSDFRVLDALVLARDTTYPDLQYLYVIRHNDQAYATAPATQQSAPPKAQSGPTIPAPNMEPEQSPTTQPAGQGANAGGTNSAAGSAGQPASNQRMVIGPTGKPMVLNGQGQAVEASGEATTRPTTDAWADALSTGKAESATTASANDFEFEAPTQPKDVRVIRVPLAKLKQGDLRYNIVIRPDDMIIVPPPVIGEYYMGGHVARVGVYNMTDRKITLKQAIVSAGMLDGLAIPDRTDIVRRIGSNKEVFVRVNLDKIFAGEEPDIYLKPNDVVNVGTNAIAPFLAALRGAFRFTYGFGFLYDRNFAYDSNQQGL